MKIVVLDGQALNPGDLSWQSIADIGELVVYDRTLPQEIIHRAVDADIVFTNKVVLDKSVLELLPNLKYIGLLSTGYNVIDLDYAKSRNIPVCNIPAYSTFSVAQMTIGLILEICIGVGKHSQSTKAGEWASSPNFSYWKQEVVELMGKTIGIIGYGEIGKRVAIIANALGMKVLAYSRTTRQNDEYATMVDCEYLMRNSDIISLHCPLNEHSQNIINAKSLACAKDGVIVINTARGGCVDEQAMLNALDSGKVSGFGADVMVSEPPERDNKLIAHSHTIITPHISWASRDARQRLLTIAVDNLKSFLDGKVQNRVN